MFGRYSIVQLHCSELMVKLVGIIKNANCCEKGVTFHQRGIIVFVAERDEICGEKIFLLLLASGKKFKFGIIY